MRSYSLFQILWSKHFFKNNVLYLIAKVEITKLSPEIMKLKHEILVSERRKEKQNVSG